jgi:hydrogenase-4 component B
MLLILFPIIPLLGILALRGIRGKSFNIPFAVASLTLVLGQQVLRDVLGGDPITYRLPFSGPYVPTFRADALSAIFVLLAAFLWWVVSIYSPEYMKREGGTRRFEVCTLATLSAVLGVFLAGDLFTLLLFFELMTITSFFWVVHRWNREAIQAGYLYLFFSIAGGLLLALGIVLIGAATSSLPAIGAGPVTPLDPHAFSWGVAALVAGFGIKAGMAPLHLWLPHAHSVAPTPASALLSGLLIKVGAYGLIRTGELVGWGLDSGCAAAWLGPALTVLGSCTMLAGVLAALLQSDAKRLLAYHSVSQMGYIILGLGVGLVMGKAGGLGLIGGIYHITNHALFKAALFLGVGVIYIRTGETNLYNMGGLWRSFPVTAVLMFLAVLGIAGAPGLNGYASKTLLHHAVSEAAQTGSPLMVWAERLFLLVGVGTAASFAKLFYLAFLAQPTELEISGGESRRLLRAHGGNCLCNGGDWAPSRALPQGPGGAGSSGVGHGDCCRLRGRPFYLECQRCRGHADHFGSWYSSVLGWTGHRSISLDASSLADTGGPGEDRRPKPGCRLPGGRRLLSLGNRTCFHDWQHHHKAPAIGLPQAG